MRILAIGDIVGKDGMNFLRYKLKQIRLEHQIDFVVANGENSAEGNGMLPFVTQWILESGVDVVTGGNHSFRRKEIFPFLENNQKVIRPYNYPKGFQL